MNLHQLGQGMAQMRVPRWCLENCWAHVGYKWTESLIVGPLRSCGPASSFTDKEMEAQTNALFCLFPLAHSQSITS